MLLVTIPQQSVDLITFDLFHPPIFSNPPDLKYLKCKTRLPQGDGAKDFEELCYLEIVMSGATCLAKRRVNMDDPGGWEKAVSALQEQLL